MTYLIDRQIGIDAGHRIPTHGSKCRNMHGHRYTIHATLRSTHLHASGEQSGMGLDFGFLKEEMMWEIDAPCDHGFIFWLYDPVLIDLLGESLHWEVTCEVNRQGWYSMQQETFGKLYIIDMIPTAENLARHWFTRLAPRVKERSEGYADLCSIKVDETPNCTAIFYPEVEENR